MTDKPLNCVGVDPAKQQIGSHDFKQHMPASSVPPDVQPGESPLRGDDWGGGSYRAPRGEHRREIPVINADAEREVCFAIGAGISLVANGWTIDAAVRATLERIHPYLRIAEAESNKPEYAKAYKQRMYAESHTEQPDEWTEEELHDIVAYRFMNDGFKKETAYRLARVALEGGVPRCPMRESVPHDELKRALMGHPMLHTKCGDSNAALPLVDMLTPGCDDSITRGIEEIDALAEALLEQFEIRRRG